MTFMKGDDLANATMEHSSTANSSSEAQFEKTKSKITTLCQCLSHFQRTCLGRTMASSSTSKQKKYNWMDGDVDGMTVNNLSFNSEMGRMIYTISILIMFAMIILLLMVRSIRRSSSTIEVETLLDAMRFREELDIQQRQKRRLQRAKNKVTAWLSRTNGKMWTSSPQIVVMPTATTTAAITKTSATANHRRRDIMRSKFGSVGEGGNAVERPENNRTNSLQSGGSYLPEIVISNSDDGGVAAAAAGGRFQRQNSCTPSLSLIYDFEIGSGRSSGGAAACTECGSEADLSQFSDLSFHSLSNELDALAAEMEPLRPLGQVPTTVVDYGGGLRSPSPKPRQQRSVSMVAEAAARRAASFRVPRRSDGSSAGATTNTTASTSLAVNPATSSSSGVLFTLNHAECSIRESEEPL